MSLQELRDRIQAYVAGQNSLDDLRDWLAEFAQDVADSDDAEVRELSGEAWVLMSEFDRGHRADDAVRHALAEYLARPTITRRSEWVWPGAEPNRVVTESQNRTPPTSSFPVKFRELGSPVNWLLGTQREGARA